MTAQPAEAEPAAISIRDVSLRYGGLDILKNVEFEVQRNEVVGLIGPNGAGKSALLNCILRVYQPAHGASISLHGDRGFSDLPPHAIAGRGVARTFQGLQLSRDLTVRDNIAVGMNAKYGFTVFESLLRPLGYWRANATVHRSVDKIAEICGVDDVLDCLPDELPLGILRRVDLARALVSRPSVLLMDEPASGLAHEERPLVADLIRTARETGDLSVIWVEHDLDLVFSTADRVVVMRSGEVVRDGRPNNPGERRELIDSYYG